MRSTVATAEAVRVNGPSAVGPLAIAALASGATAIGALAIGRLVIGRAVVKAVQAGEVDIDTLRVRRLEVDGQVWSPTDRA